MSTKRRNLSESEMGTLSYFLNVSQKHHPILANDKQRLAAILLIQQFSKATVSEEQSESHRLEDRIEYLIPVLMQAAWELIEIFVKSQATYLTALTLVHIVQGVLTEEATDLDAIEFGERARYLADSYSPQLGIPAKTNLELNFNNRVVNEVEVEFSQEEIDEIIELRQLMENSFKERALDGSGWERELYLNASIPWGFSLQKRFKAIISFKRSLAEMEKWLLFCAKHQIADQYTDDLAELFKRTSNFVASLKVQSSYGDK